jgi:hypothetical protein
MASVMSFIPFLEVRVAVLLPEGDAGHYVLDCAALQPEEDLGHVDPSELVLLPVADQEVIVLLLYLKRDLLRLGDGLADLQRVLPGLLPVGCDDYYRFYFHF